MRVDFSHAERIHKALVAGGVPSLFIPVKDGAHALVHPKLREIVGRFFDRHLRDMTVEIPDAPLEPVAPASATAK
jgi:dipeptidyl aminopeptidase/acylaminoacyl peptidase